MGEKCAGGLGSTKQGEFKLKGEMHMVYRRGRVWWYKFWFNGQLIRESANSGSKTVAREAEKARRRELELAVNRIPKRERVPLFSLAAQEWLAGKDRHSREQFGEVPSMCSAPEGRIWEAACL
jgi:hypothetical protein